MVIRVHEISGAADTEAQGEAVYQRVMADLGKKEHITISFVEVDTATSSFVNASFVEILSSISFAEFKHRVRITDSTRQINDMIKRCLTRETELSVI